MKKHLTMGLVISLLLFVPFSSAICLTPGQIFIAGKIAETSNVSVDDVVGIFNMLCYRMENLTSNITILTQQDVNLTVSQHIEDYKSEIEEKMRVIDAITNNTLAIQAMAKIQNTSQAIDAIDSKVDSIRSEFSSQHTAFVEQVNDKVQDLRAEQVGRNEYESLSKNLSDIESVIHSHIISSRTPQADYTGLAVFLVIAGICGGYIYLKKRKDKSIIEAINSGAAPTPEKSRSIHVSHMDEDKDASELRSISGYREAERAAQMEEDAETEQILKKEIEEDKQVRKEKIKKARSRNEDPFKT